MRVELDRGEIVHAENIFYCSFGKDSLAQILLAHENNIKIDYIVFVEVMFTKEISGENPKHIAFVYNKAIPKLKELGYETTILHSDKTYYDLFHQKRQRSKYPERIGKMNGYALSGLCILNDRCKMRPIKKFNKRHPNAIRYVGIAFDEPKRLARLSGNKKSLLAEFNYTEQMAKDLCVKYDLLSPVYNYSNRNGCWFCPNANIERYIEIVNDFPEYWKILTEWSNGDTISNIFVWNKSIDEINLQIEKRLQNES